MVKMRLEKAEFEPGTVLLVQTENSHAAVAMVGMDGGLFIPEPGYGTNCYSPKAWIGSKPGWRTYRVLSVLWKPPEDLLQAAALQYHLGQAYQMPEGPDV